MSASKQSSVREAVLKDVEALSSPGTVRDKLSALIHIVGMCQQNAKLADQLLALPQPDDERLPEQKQDEETAPSGGGGSVFGYVTEHSRRDCLLRAVLRAVRTALGHSERDVRVQGLRCVRYLLCSEPVVAETLVHCKLDLFAAVSLCRDSKDNPQPTERLEAFKLIRKMIALAPTLVSRSCVQAMLAVAEHQRDYCRFVCLDGLRDLALVNPRVVVECGGVRALVEACLDHSVPQRARLAVLRALVCLLDRPDSRALLRPTLDLSPLLIPYTDLSAAHAAERDCLSDAKTLQKGEDPRKSAGKRTDPRRAKHVVLVHKVRCAELALTTLLHSWSGLLVLCGKRQDDGQVAVTEAEGDETPPESPVGPQPGSLTDNSTARGGIHNANRLQDWASVKSGHHTISTLRPTGNYYLQRECSLLRSLMQVLSLPPTVPGGTFCQLCILQLIFRVLRVTRSGRLAGSPRVPPAVGRRVLPPAAGTPPNLLSNFGAVLLLALLNAGVVHALVRVLLSGYAYEAVAQEAEEGDGPDASSTRKAVGVLRRGAIFLLHELFAIARFVLPERLQRRMNVLRGLVTRATGTPLDRGDAHSFRDFTQAAGVRNLDAFSAQRCAERSRRLHGGALTAQSRAAVTVDNTGDSLQALLPSRASVPAFHQTSASTSSLNWLTQLLVDSVSTSPIHPPFFLGVGARVRWGLCGRWDLPYSNGTDESSTDHFSVHGRSRGDFVHFLNRFADLDRLAVVYSGVLEARAWNSGEDGAVSAGGGRAANNPTSPRGIRPSSLRSGSRYSGSMAGSAPPQTVDSFFPTLYQSLHPLQRHWLAHFRPAALLDTAHGLRSGEQGNPAVSWGAHGLRIALLAYDSDLSYLVHRSHGTDHWSVYLRYCALLSRNLARSCGESEIAARMKQCGVVGAKRTYAQWNFATIFGLLEGPCSHGAGFQLGLKNKCFKRLLSFLKPAKCFFARLDWSVPNVLYSACARRLIRVMLTHRDGVGYEFFDELMREIVEALCLWITRDVRMGRDGTLEALRQDMHREVSALSGGMERSRQSYSRGSVMQSSSGVQQFAARRTSQRGSKFPATLCEPFSRVYQSRTLSREYVTLLCLLMRSPAHKRYFDAPLPGGCAEYGKAVVWQHIKRGMGSPDSINKFYNPADPSTSKKPESKVVVDPRVAGKQITVRNLLQGLALFRHLDYLTSRFVQEMEYVDAPAFSVQFARSLLQVWFQWGGTAVRLQVIETVGEFLRDCIRQDGLPAYDPMCPSVRESLGPAAVRYARASPPFLWAVYILLRALRESDPDVRLAAVRTLEAAVRRSHWVLTVVADLGVDLSAFRLPGEATRVLALQGLVSALLTVPAGVKWALEWAGTSLPSPQRSGKTAEKPTQSSGGTGVLDGWLRRELARWVGPDPDEKDAPAGEYKSNDDRSVATRDSAAAFRFAQVVDQRLVSALSRLHRSPSGAREGGAVSLSRAGRDALYRRVRRLPWHVELTVHRNHLIKVLQTDCMLITEYQLPVAQTEGKGGQGLPEDLDMSASPVALRTVFRATILDEKGVPCPEAILPSDVLTARLLCGSMAGPVFEVEQRSEVKGFDPTATTGSSVSVGVFRRASHMPSGGNRGSTSLVASDFSADFRPAAQTGGGGKGVWNQRTPLAGGRYQFLSRVSDLPSAAAHGKSSRRAEEDSESKDAHGAGGDGDEPQNASDRNGSAAPDASGKPRGEWGAASGQAASLTFTRMDGSSYHPPAKESSLFSYAPAGTQGNSVSALRSVVECAPVDMHRWAAGYRLPLSEGRPVESAGGVGRSLSGATQPRTTTSPSAGSAVGVTYVCAPDVREAVTASQPFCRSPDAHSQSGLLWRFHVDEPKNVRGSVTERAGAGAVLPSRSVQQSPSSQQSASLSSGSELGSVGPSSLGGRPPMLDTASTGRRRTRGTTIGMLGGGRTLKLAHLDFALPALCEQHGCADSGSPVLPGHLFGALAATADGCAVLKSHRVVDRLLQAIEREAWTHRAYTARFASCSGCVDVPKDPAGFWTGGGRCVTLRSVAAHSALWGLGVIGARQHGYTLIRSTLAARALKGDSLADPFLAFLTHNAAHNPVFSVRGTCYNVLALLSECPGRADALRRLDWHVGVSQRGVCVPGDPQDMLSVSVTAGVPGGAGSFLNAFGLCAVPGKTDVHAELVEKRVLALQADCAVQPPLRVPGEAAGPMVYVMGREEGAAERKVQEGSALSGDTSPWMSSAGGAKPPGAVASALLSEYGGQLSQTQSQWLRLTAQQRCVLGHISNLAVSVLSKAAISALRGFAEKPEYRAALRSPLTWLWVMRLTALYSFGLGARRFIFFEVMKQVDWTWSVEAAQGAEVKGDAAQSKSGEEPAGAGEKPADAMARIQSEKARFERPYYDLAALSAWPLAVAQYDSELDSRAPEVANEGMEPAVSNPEAREEPTGAPSDQSSESEEDEEVASDSESASD